VLEALATADPHREGGVLRDVVDKGRDQGRLADPGLAGDEDDLTGTVQSRREAPAQVAELGVPREEGPSPGGPRPGRGRLGRRRIPRRRRMPGFSCGGLRRGGASRFFRRSAAATVLQLL
jgi:hypothetical protein